MKDIFIGTSGYDYPEWKGVFYPPEIKRKDFLAYYSTVFNTLELNNTFYSMPTVERFEKLVERTDNRLRFSIKANRLLTHEISRDWKNVAGDFKNCVNLLYSKQLVDAVLFQFPQSFHYTAENRIYLSELIKSFYPFPVVIEFRHKEWIRESVFAGLEERHASIAFCDMPQLKYLPDGNACKTPFVGDVAYIRLHGRNADAWYANLNEETANQPANPSARYDYNYSDFELQSFIPIIKTAKQEGKKVVVYFNNHPKGNGAKNAISLKLLVDVE